MGEKLKSCPFCGDQPVYEEWGEFEFWIVKCDNNHCVLFGNEMSPAGWNHRPSAEPEKCGECNGGGKGIGGHCPNCNGTGRTGTKEADG